MLQESFLHIFKHKASKIRLVTKNKTQNPLYYKFKNLKDIYTWLISPKKNLKTPKKEINLNHQNYVKPKIRNQNVFNTKIFTKKLKYKIIVNQNLKIRTKRTNKLKTRSSYNTPYNV